MLVKMFIQKKNKRRRKTNRSFCFTQNLKIILIYLYEVETINVGTLEKTIFYET